MYLGTKLCKTRLHNVIWAQAMSPSKYVHEAVRNGIVTLSSNYGGKYRMPKKAENPFKTGYGPDFDTSPELDPDAESYYLMITCVLRWINELKRMDLMSEVSLFSSHRTIPR